MTGHSQISVDTTFSINNGGSTVLNIRFSMVKLSNSGYKYVIPDLLNNKITLYNLNHSVFKTLNLPITSTNIYFYDISEDLFDTNPTTVEYLIYYYSTNKIVIADESGTILLSKDSAQLGGYMFDHSQHIVWTPTGVKLLLASSVLAKVYSYNLPGNIVCSDCTNGQITSIMQSSGDNNAEQSLPYPNPTSNSLKIKYTLPKDIQKAKISFYNTQGKELKTMDIDNNFNDITVDKGTLGVTSGIYFYKIYTADKVLSTNKIIFE